MRKTFKICISIILCLTMIFAATSCDLIEKIKDYIPTDGSDDVIADNTDGVTDTGDADNEAEKDDTQADIIADILSRPVNCDDIQYIVGLDAHNRPEGYTAGLTTHKCDLAEYGYYWLETYEEVLEAIALLEYNGSNVVKSIGFDFDGEPYDVKWCFFYQRHYGDELEYGKHYFDRTINNCQFICYTFSEEITIEELIFTKTYLHGGKSITYSFNDVVIEDRELLSVSWKQNEEKPTEYFVLYDGVEIAVIDSPVTTEPLSEERIEILLNSLIIFADGTYEWYDWWE